MKLVKQLYPVEEILFYFNNVLGFDNADEIRVNKADIGSYIVNEFERGYISV